MTPWHFIHTGDIHYGSPRSFRFRPSAIENWETAVGQIKRLNPDLLLSCGDLAQDGWRHPHELVRIREALEQLPFPCHSVAGNMDVGNKTAHHNGATGEDDISHNVRSDLLKNFADNFGPYNWSFVHKDVRFTGMCEMLAGSGLPEEQALWDLVESLRKKPKARLHVCVMHYPLFVDTIDEPTFDNRELDQYRRWYDNIDKPERLSIYRILKELDVSIVFCGHVHHNRTRRAGKIRFIACTGTAFKKRAPADDTNDFGFVWCKVTTDGIAAEFVPLEKESNAIGYGPTGHDPVRDYSLAWEKPSYGDP
jgi:3',5'-cyclic AMP phosphodiesterase CpdA